jgi:hypothetical protein
MENGPGARWLSFQFRIKSLASQAKAQKTKTVGILLGILKSLIF